jgi:hypothetical protein
MLRIFCPYRDRLQFYRDFVPHYRAFFPDAVIYMLEQTDSSLFKRGQLMNAAFIHLLRENVPLDNMLFVDVDIRMKYPIDFEELLRKNSTVVIPYNELQLYRLNNPGHYVSENKPSYFLSAPDGGVTLFTRSMFEACNGFSNLYIGWGREDSDFVRRNKVTRVPNKMIHLTHPRHSEWKSDAFQRNDALFKMGPDFRLDGFRQTTADVQMSLEGRNLFHLHIKNMGVVAGYAYQDKMIQEAPCGVK